MPQAIKMFLKDFEFDEENPNQMSEEQESGLDKALSKFGFLENIIASPLNENGKRKIHHGEHRIKSLIKSGNEWVWGIEKDLTDAEHRLLRQSMNKLHGTHDAKMDAAEYEILQEQGQLELLSVLIAQPKEQLIVEKELAVPITKDAAMLDHHKETFQHGQLKQLYFIFDNEGYVDIMNRLAKIKEKEKPETNTDLFLLLVENYEKNNIEET